MKAFLFRSAALALLALGVVQSMRNGSRGVAQEPKGVELSEARGFNSSRCGHCHNVQAGAEISSATRRSLDFIRLDENILWEKEDLHSAAHRNIVPSRKGEPANLAARMESALRKTRGDKYEVAKAHECLACHATDTKPGEPVALQSAVEGRFLTEQGVNCSVCHGNANKWFEPHSEPTAWREKVNAADKEKYGLLDMRDPAKRSQLCATCHVGDREKGRFVTHEMFAAGHPPLAPFETGRFGADQPAHYRPAKDNKVLMELAAANPDEAWKRFHVQPSSSHSDKAREIVLGSLAAFKSSIQLIASEAKDAGDKRWFDLATFDCFACHHELKYPGERQERGYGNRVAGRPVWKPGFDRLFFAVLDFASAANPEWKAKAEGIRTDLAALDKTLETRPLGDSKRVDEAAAKLLAVTDTLIQEVGADRALFTKENAGKLFAAVVAEALPKPLPPEAKSSLQPYYIDFEAALPLAWAMIELAKDAKGGDKVKGAAAAFIGTLPVEVKDPKSHQALAGKRLKDRMDMLNKFESAKFAEAAKKFADAVK